MKNLLKYAMLFAAAGTLSMSFTACSSDDDNNSSDDGFNIVTTAPVVDQDTYTANTSSYKDKSFGETPIRLLPPPRFLQNRKLISTRCLRTSWTK